MYNITFSNQMAASFIYWTNTDILKDDKYRPIPLLELIYFSFTNLCYFVIVYHIKTQYNVWNFVELCQTFKGYEYVCTAL